MRDEDEKQISQSVKPNMVLQQDECYGHRQGKYDQHTAY